MSSYECSSLESEGSAEEVGLSSRHLEKQGKTGNITVSRNSIVPACEEDGSVFFASFQVSILHHTGPGTIYVQRIDHEEENYWIDVAIEFFTKMEQEGVFHSTPLSSLRPGAL